MVSIVQYLVEMSIIPPSEIKAKMPTYQTTFADKAREARLARETANRQRYFVKNTMR